MRDRDLFQITVRFVEQMKEVIGPTTDIPAPDGITKVTIMGWIMHKYSKYAGFSTGQAGKDTRHILLLARPRPLCRSVLPAGPRLT